VACPGFLRVNKIKGDVGATRDPVLFVPLQVRISAWREHVQPEPQYKHCIFNEIGKCMIGMGSAPQSMGIEMTMPS
jgi:hypothetical protein